MVLNHALRVGIVVRHAGPGMGSGDLSIGQERGNCFTCHRGSPISVHDVGDAMNTKYFFHQIYRKFTTFVVVDVSANDVRGLNIEHHIAIKIDTFDRSGEFGDVPRIHLSRCCCHEFRDCSGWVTG